MGKYESFVSGYEYKQDHDYVSDSNYLVVIDDKVLGFSKVRNLSMKQEEEIYREGGGDTVTQTMQTDNNNVEILTLEKGVLKKEKSPIIKNLIPGCKIRELSVIILNGKKEIEKVLYFEQGIVTKRSFSDLDAVSGDVLKLTLEISHSGLIEQV